MKNEIVNFERKDLFWQYHNRDNPFLIVTTKIDITNIYKNFKNYYPALAYFITMAVNKIDNFKYRYIQNKFYKFDKLNPSFTDIKPNKEIGFFRCDIDFHESYNNFLEKYKSVKEKFILNGEDIISLEENEIWVSCLPWFSFTSLIPPFDKNITIPQFIWDKFEFVDGKCYTNLMIMAHHGFVDGYHISLFLKELNDIISNIERNQSID